MDAIDFLNKEYENTENFNTRALLRKLNPLEQSILIELMNKFAVQLANVNPTSQEQLATPDVMESLPHTQYRWVCGKCDFSSLKINWNKCPNCGNVP